MYSKKTPSGNSINGIFLWITDQLVFLYVPIWQNNNRLCDTTKVRAHSVAIFRTSDGNFGARLPVINDHANGAQTAHGQWQSSHGWIGVFGTAEAAISDTCIPNWWHIICKWPKWQAIIWSMTIWQCLHPLATCISGARPQIWLVAEAARQHIIQLLHWLHHHPHSGRNVGPQIRWQICVGRGHTILGNHVHSDAGGSALGRCECPYGRAICDGAVPRPTISKHIGIAGRLGANQGARTIVFAGILRNDGKSMAIGQFQLYLYIGLSSYRWAPLPLHTFRAWFCITPTAIGSWCSISLACWPSFGSSFSWVLPNGKCYVCSAGS